MKNLVILGSSGSIGKNALWVAERFPEELKIFGLSVNSDITALTEQVKKYHPSVVCVSDDKTAAKFIPAAKSLNVELLSGESGLEALSSIADVEIVLNSVVGFAGLRSTIAAARAGKRIALANKESMVAGGQIVNDAVSLGAAELIPVDSEHSAIFQCLKSGNKDDVRRLILTSSGGPFRKLPKEKFSSITVEQALKHPTWNMGKKITIDSATLMNKGLEIIEAHYLFGIPEKNIDVVIHPQSIIHSMVEYIDGSIISQMSKPDMRLPIEFALFYPNRKPISVANLDFSAFQFLEFEPPDEHKFKSLNIARQALKRGGTAPAIYNAANEIAAQAFLDERIRFDEIFSLVDHVCQSTEIVESDSIEAIISADMIGRTNAQQFINKERI